MSKFVVTPWSGPATTLEAEAHELVGGFHVFTRTAWVLGNPRSVVVRRVSEAVVASVALESPGQRP